MWCLLFLVWGERHGIRVGTRRVTLGWTRPKRREGPQTDEYARHSARCDEILRTHASDPPARPRSSRSTEPPASGIHAVSKVPRTGICRPVLNLETSGDPCSTCSPDP